MEAEAKESHDLRQLPPGVGGQLHRQVDRF
jgi:hypothetical protein